MTKKAFLALTVVAAGCSSGPVEPGATTASSWMRIEGDRPGTTAHLGAVRTGDATLLLSEGASVERVTKRFLSEHKDLFAMRDPDAELALSRSRSDALGMRHARFQQVVHGVPVAGAEVMVHYDAAGRLTSLDAAYVAGIDDLDVNPSLDIDTALERAKADVLGRMPDVEEAQLEAGEDKLVVFAGAAGTRSEARLAFQFAVRAIAGEHPAIWVVTVDARTGAILDLYDNLQTVEASSPGALGDVKKFEVTASGGGYVMTDTSRGVAIRTYTAGGQQQTPGAAVTSTTLTQWDRNVTGAGAAVDAHVHAGLVFDYYKTKHQRNGLDGDGAAMESTAHFGTAFDNAFWDGRGMTYGDGGDRFRPLSAGLDVVAHEFTHGVIQAESNLTYQNQSGALNEAVADIFGAFIEHAYKADPTNNWRTGEAIVKGAQASLMRDFKNPAAGAQPAHMSNYRNTQQDNGGVHINSGIINNAAFLMTDGGTNPVSKVEVKYGIGWEKAEKVWYRANAEYFISSTNFAQAAQGVLEAAKDLGLSANEQAIIECAWKAVGIAQGACATITDPNAKPQTSPPAPSGEETGSSAGPGAGTVGGSSDDESAADEGDEDEGSDGRTTASPRRRGGGAGFYDSSGCTVKPHGSGDASAAAWLVAAVLAVGAKRRRRPRVL